MVLDVRTRALRSHDFRSRKHAFLSLLVVIIAPALSVLHVLVSVVDHVAIQVRYIHLSSSLRDLVLDIAPLARILAVPVAPLGTLLAFSMFLVLVALAFKGVARARGTSIPVRDAWGITVKAWVLQVPLMLVGILGTVLFLYPSFIDALNGAQLDAGNNIDVGIFLRDMLAGYTVYFALTGLAGVPFHALSVRVLDAYAASKQAPVATVREAYFTGVLLVSAMLLVVLALLLGVAFSIFTGISIEGNPLQ